MRPGEGLASPSLSQGRWSGPPTLPWVSPRYCAPIVHAALFLFRTHSPPVRWCQLKTSHQCDLKKNILWIKSADLVCSHNAGLCCLKPVDWPNSTFKQFISSSPFSSDNLTMPLYWKRFSLWRKERNANFYFFCSKFQKFKIIKISKVQNNKKEAY